VAGRARGPRRARLHAPCIDVAVCRRSSTVVRARRATGHWTTYELRRSFVPARIRPACDPTNVADLAGHCGHEDNPTVPPHCPCRVADAIDAWDLLLGPRELDAGWRTPAPRQSRRRRQRMLRAHRRLSRCSPSASDPNRGCRPVPPHRTDDRTSPSETAARAHSLRRTRSAEPVITGGHAGVARWLTHRFGCTNGSRSRASTLPPSSASAPRISPRWIEHTTS
jgi:hypothetical protein